jgi:ABC-2 type transport system ATP-binding protein
MYSDRARPDKPARTRARPPIRARREQIPQMTQNAIQIEGLKKTYAAQGNQSPKEALKGIDLDIRAGSIFGLLGPNGAGKSTLINILAGLVLKSAGKVRIWGFDQDVNPRQSRASIGVMPQELNMDPFFSPRRALEVQAGLYGVPKARRQTDEILEMIGLTDKADAYARSLSGGMRRRLLLGKALVHAPQVLVLDEPTAGVDIELRQMLWSNVRKLNAERGMTIILTTHYLEEAEQMCDEIAIVNHGAVVVRDKTSNLIGRLDAKTLVITPQEPLTSAITLPEGVTLEQRPGGVIALSYRRGVVSANTVLEAVRDAGVQIADVTSEQADLEDVFLALTTSSAA